MGGLEKRPPGAGGDAPVKVTFGLATPRARAHRLLGGILRWGLRVLFWGATVLATVVLLRAFDARRLPDLQLWHRVHLESEFRARDLASTTTLEDYLKREDRLFDELERKVVDRVPASQEYLANRYWRESPMNPERFDRVRNWNRTFELLPEGPVQGGALLVHGMSDSPYTMRHVAEVYRGMGFYVLALRMPGHGTVPAELARVKWEDWLAAVRLGARAVRHRIGPDLPFQMGGYSNGGALALKYALDAAAGSGDPQASKLVLISPMIGVSPFARFSALLGALGVFPYFEKARWLDDMPEYIPYKYNSFPTNAGEQSHRLTDVIDGDLARAQKAGRMGKLPPILAFQSVVDATVSTDAVVKVLYSRVSGGRDELVVFGVNETENVRPFLKSTDLDRLKGLFGGQRRDYRLTVVACARSDSPEVVERSLAPLSSSLSITPLHLAWPPRVYSLSHLALPVPADDPLFGLGGPVGGMAPRGEKGELTVPMDQVMRLYCNPFFPYLKGRLEAWIASAPAAR